MSLAFLVPLALAALAALLLPLLIHLARRSEQRPTEFAALRWLRQKPKPRHRIRFDEWPLLLVRLLLLALLAVLLARPVLHGGDSDAPYVAVVPGVDAALARKDAVARGARWHWLAPGFPALDAAPPPSAAPITSLLRELDAALPPDVALTVFVPAQLQGADGERVKLSRRVDWRVLPGATPAGAAATDSAPVLAVRHAASREASVRYLRAAQGAWHASAPPKLDDAPPSQPLDPATRQLAWLVPGDVPDAVREWVDKGGTLLLDPEARFEGAPALTALWRDDAGVALVEGGAFGQGRVLRFTRVPVPQAMPQLLDPGFPRQLRALLAPPPASPTRVLSQSHAPVAGAATFPVRPRDLQPWLALLVALVFLVERWLASGARRQVAP
ncbi:MAG TPA: BatA domain-containing protein [Lysobacter sp.]